MSSYFLGTICCCFFFNNNFDFFLRNYVSFFIYINTVHVFLGIVNKVVFVIHSNTS